MQSLGKSRVQHHQRPHGRWTHGIWNFHWVSVFYRILWLFQTAEEKGFRTWNGTRFPIFKATSYSLATGWLIKIEGYLKPSYMTDSLHAKLAYIFLKKTFTFRWSMVKLLAVHADEENMWLDCQGCKTGDDEISWAKMGYHSVAQKPIATLGYADYYLILLVSSREFKRNFESGMWSGCSYQGLLIPRVHQTFMTYTEVSKIVQYLLRTRKFWINFWLLNIVFFCVPNALSHSQV